MRLEVTRKSDLAVRALHALAQSESRLKGSELAEELCASPAFMAQVMTPLVKQRWVDSNPGPTGGYELRASLDDVSVLDVIEAIEGPIDTEMCVVADRPCAEDGHCALHFAWTKARQTLADELRRTSISATAETHDVADILTIRHLEKTDQ